MERGFFLTPIPLYCEEWLRWGRGNNCRRALNVVLEEDMAIDFWVDSEGKAHDPFYDRQPQEDPQEEEKRKEERRERYNTEVDRTLALTSLADDYDTASKIRRYLAALEISGSLSSETSEWIEWAKSKADWYDPTIAKEDDFFWEREHAKPEEEKRLRQRNYWS